MKMIVALALALVSTSCATDNTPAGAPLPAAPSQTGGIMERAFIVGSAEVPDPVLTRVRELEKSGVVTDVVVLESFPVQIHLRAPRAIIDELDKIPRVGGLK